MAATGWQAHTVRAALSTLRKDGEVITRIGRGETMRYVARDPR
jgi:DNA-binding GntR family transcriptional regulator